MSLIEAIVLGIVQGLTEFLPISSTAHLCVIPTLLGWGDPGAAYSAVIQLGSVIAVIAYFHKEIVEMLKGTFQAVKNKDFTSHEFRLFSGICLGTLPICILGLLLKPILEQEASPLRTLSVIGASSIVMGLLLLLAEKQNKQNRNISLIGARDGFFVGLGQALALIPGCSRSGSTLTVAMFLNLKREDAARFSFLLGIPAIVLSGLLELKKMLTIGLDQGLSMNLLVSFLVSLVVSYAAIAWFLRYLQVHSTGIFVAYRFLFGLSVLAVGLNLIHIH